ncbi:MAG: hypothetical protein JXA82_08410 [Sedimentisphaerales bacterium]|nr:hypothetical protein [Sedimentisphaerales bacterium]
MHQETVRRIVAGWLCMMVAILLVGCSDNPDNKAIKNLNEQVSKAIAQVRSTGAVKASASGKELEAVDLAAVHAQARQKIQSALRNAPRGHQATAAGYMASANLAMGQAEFARIAMDTRARRMREMLDSVKTQTERINELLIQEASLRNLLQTMKEGVTSLGEIVDKGIGDKPSLQDLLASVQDRLSLLRRKKASFTMESQEAQDKIARIQAQAGELLKQAEQMTGIDKVRSQNDAYSLLVSQKPLFIEAQNASDQAALVQTQIDVVVPLLTQIQNQLAMTQEKLEKIQSSPEQEKLQSQIEMAASKITEREKQLGELMTQLQASFSEYNSDIDQVLGLYEEAAADYGKARGRQGGSAAMSSVGEAYTNAALLAADNVDWHRQTRMTLEVLQQIEPERLRTIFTPVVSLTSDSMGTYTIKATDYFSKAGEQYESISNSPAGAKSYLLCLYAQMTFADRNGNLEAYDKANTKARELLKKTLEADPTFSRTATAQLFNGLQGYVPQLPVDRSAWYDQRKLDMQSWKPLRGKAAEQRVVELLAKYDQLLAESENAPEFVRELGPLKKEMEEALQKGFPEDTTTTTTTRPGEPNIVR